MQFAQIIQECDKSKLSILFTLQTKEEGLSAQDIALFTGVSLKKVFSSLKWFRSQELVENYSEPSIPDDLWYVRKEAIEWQENPPLKSQSATPIVKTKKSDFSKACPKLKLKKPPPITQALLSQKQALQSILDYVSKKDEIRAEQFTASLLVGFYYDELSKCLSQTHEKLSQLMGLRFHQDLSHAKLLIRKFKPEGAFRAIASAFSEGKTPVNWFNKDRILDFLTDNRFEIKVLEAIQKKPEPKPQEQSFWVGPSTTVNGHSLKFY